MAIIVIMLDIVTVGGMVVVATCKIVEDVVVVVMVMTVAVATLERVNLSVKVRNE